MKPMSAVPTDDWEFLLWCARKGAKTHSQEVRRSMISTQAPEPLRHTLRIAHDRVAPILAEEGIPMSKEELERIFIDWYVDYESHHPKSDTQKGHHEKETV